MESSLNSKNLDKKPNERPVTFEDSITVEGTLDWSKLIEN